MFEEIKEFIYTPINYRDWIVGDEARSGINIKKLKILTSEEHKILEEAIPYQDQREDPGQAELVTYFASNLLQYVQDAKREIAIPSAILHDIGWYGGESDYWKKLVASGGETESEGKRRPHQNRGLLLAGKVLNETGYLDKYPKEYWLEIADIIGDHDSRKLPATSSGQVVRDADVLWRFTLPCMKIYYADAGKSAYETFNYMFYDELKKPSRFHIPESYQIARTEIANTMHNLFTKETPELLKQDFGKELEKIISFYQTPQQQSF